MTILGLETLILSVKLTYWENEYSNCMEMDRWIRQISTL